MPVTGEQEAPAAPDENLLPLSQLLNQRQTKNCSPLSYSRHLSNLNGSQSIILEHPYCLPLYVLLAQDYLRLEYPDLAAGAAYKALLLSDAVRDEGDEFHESAMQALETVAGLFTSHEWMGVLRFDKLNPASEDQHETVATEMHSWLAGHCLKAIYGLLARGLALCGCSRTALDYLEQACRLGPTQVSLQSERLKDSIYEQIAQSRNTTSEALSSGEHSQFSTGPDQGHVRREVYPWNVHEPDRVAELSTLNSMMAEIAPKLEVRATSLPNLSRDPSNEGAERVTQLGVFAKEDIAPDEVVLDETSLLTANNKLQDALCDACSADLPDLASGQAELVVSCSDCEVVFCSQRCHDLAMELYHPALCGMDVESIAKDVQPTEAADSLYSLLLLRTLAMAETQQCHPLDLKEVKYIWGDFLGLDPQAHWAASPPKDGERRALPKTLPFSFEHNIRLPFHMLEKMDVDIFANPQYDVWVFNTLYAKFRGTASARLSGLGGRAARGPEVSAVHPMWCLANHSCDPNVSWEWGGSIKFWARRQRVTWKNGSETKVENEAAISRDEEVLNHYCDVDLGVNDRREWAKGALGGDCQCERCVWEAEDAQPNGAL